MCVRDDLCPQPRDRFPDKETPTVFILYLVLFLGGIYLMGFAFNVTDFEGLVFTGGLLLTSLAVGLPFLLGAIERRGDTRPDAESSV